MSARPTEITEMAPFLVFIIIGLIILYIVAGVAPIMINTGVVITMFIIVGGGMWLLFGRHEGKDNSATLEDRHRDGSTLEDDDYR